jgi:hypothetical protein
VANLLECPEADLPIKCGSGRRDCKTMSHRTRLIGNEMFKVVQLESNSSRENQ